MAKDGLSALSKDSHQATGRAPIPAFPLASLYHSPPRLPPSQPLLLLAVLGKVQSVGSGWRQASLHQCQQKQSLA